MSPDSATHTLDPVATTEAIVVVATPSFECSVENCLVDYQQSVTPQSQAMMRCHSLRRLEFCMRKSPIRCQLEDERYIFIDSKRTESANQFRCGFQGARADLNAVCRLLEC